MLSTHACAVQTRFSILGLCMQKHHESLPKWHQKCFQFIDKPSPEPMRKIASGKVRRGSARSHKRHGNVHAKFTRELRFGPKSSSSPQLLPLLCVAWFPKGLHSGANTTKVTKIRETWKKIDVTSYPRRKKCVSPV